MRHFFQIRKAEDFISRNLIYKTLIVCHGCPAQHHWRVINEAVNVALSSVTLADMARRDPIQKLVQLRMAAGTPTG